MDSNLHYDKRTYWNKLLKKFQYTYSALISERDNEDKFKLKLLQQKLLQLYRKILRLQHKIGVKIAETAMGFLLLSTPLTAQNVNYGGVLKSSTPMDILGNKTITVGDIDGDGGKDMLLGSASRSILFFKDRGQDYYDAKGDLPISFQKRLSNSLLVTPFLIDYDGDGDADLFVSNKNGKIFYFENENSKFVFADTVKANGNTNFNSNARIFLTDFDGDGKYDLFVGEKNGYVTYYKGDGSFNFAAGQKLKDKNNTAISLSYSCPALIDLDNDGHLDLLVGSSKKDIKYFHNTGNGTFDPAQALTADGTAIISDVSTLITLYDMDGDKDLDLLVSFKDAIKYYQNNNGTFSFVKNLQSDQLSLKGVSNISFADLDGDNDLDLFVGTDKKIRYYKNVDNKFSFVSNLKSQTSDITSATTTAVYPDLTDFDKDGKVDLIVGIDTVVEYYKNVDGTFQFQNKLSYAGHTISHDMPIPVVADITGDQSPDLYLGTNDDYLFYYPNSGSAFQSENQFKFDNSVVKFPNGVAIAFADINGDGNKDMLLASFSNSSLQYALNDGTGKFGKIDTLKLNDNHIFDFYGAKLGSSDLDKDGKPELYYINGDGNVDIFLMEGVNSIKKILPRTIDIGIYSSGNKIIVDTKNFKDVKIKIYSISGALIISKASNESFNTFDGLTKGIYLVKVLNPKGVAMAKVVVQ